MNNVNIKSLRVLLQAFFMARYAINYSETTAIVWQTPMLKKFSPTISFIGEKRFVNE